MDTHALGHTESDTSAQEIPVILVTIEDAAGMLHVGRSTMYKLTSGDEPEIPKIKIGTSTRIAVDDLKAYVDRLRRAAA